MTTLRGIYGTAAAMLFATALAFALCVQIGPAFAVDQENLGGGVATAEAHRVSAAGSKLPKAKVSKKAVRQLYSGVLDGVAHGKYAIFDVDGNGTKELLVQSGPSTAFGKGWSVYTVSKGTLKRLKPQLWGSPRSKGKELYLVQEIDYGYNIYKLSLGGGKVKKKLASKMTVHFDSHDNATWSGESQYKSLRSKLTSLKVSSVAKRSLLKKL